MNKEELYRLFLEILDNESVFMDEPMKKHISFKVGGPCDILVRPKSVEEIRNVMKVLKEKNIPFLIKGNGTNILIRDGGYRGVVIELSDNFNEVKINGSEVEVQAGELLSIIGKKVMEASLTGFEFASGIPGTLGGAIAMNAGAYGGEMKNIIKEVTLVDMDGNVVTYNNKEMDFGYRHSVLTDTDMIAISAIISLEPGNYEEIKEKMEDLALRRRTNQPLEYPSAGSTFKRPEGYFAGKLIQDSDLKGSSVGGAMVSEKHSGFVINYDNATAKDITDLIEHVKKTVYEKQGVHLEEEVKIFGEH